MPNLAKIIAANNNKVLSEDKVFKRQLPQNSNCNCNCNCASRMATFLSTSRGRPWPPTPTTTPPPTAAGSASWKSSPSCASRSSPPSIRGTSSSHPASTSKQNSWTMLSHSFHFGTELLTWPDFVFMLVSFCLSEETSVQLFETWSDKQENHNFLQSRCIYVYK